MTVLASGSRGNATVVTGGRTTVLVDAGLSCRELVKRMQQAGEDPRTLDAILITHEHQDHVQGLSVLARRLGIPVYFTEATHRAWMRWMTPQRRMTYADWLATRKAEAEKAAAQGFGAPAWSTPTLPVPEERAISAAATVAETSPNSADTASAATTVDRLDSSYRDAELRACAEEAAEYEQELAGKPSSEELCTEECFEPAQTGEKISGRTATASVAGTMAVAPQVPQAAEAVSVFNPTALPSVEYFKSGKPFSIGDLQVSAFTIPHDAADPVGFVLESEGVKVGLATDLGYMPANVSQQLRGCDVVMLESNHDLDMLRDGPYPWSVKQRVLSRVGHLSNAAAADFLEKGYDGQAAYVVLAHLSESNNLPELARIAAEWALRDRMKLLANRLVIAAQHEPTESIRL